MIYKQGPARRLLLGQQSTNPTIAGKYLMGARRASAAARKLTPGRRRTYKKSNPALALTSLLGGPVGKVLGKLFGGAPRYQNGPLMTTLQSFLDKTVQGDLAALRAFRGAVTSPGKHQAQWRNAWLEFMPPLMTSLPAAVRTAAIALDPTLTTAGVPGAAAAAGPGSLFDPKLMGGLAIPVVRELTKKPRATRGRYPTYVDRQGRQRYSTKPPGTELRIPAGASPSPGSPYSFFRGAVGKGGAAATAGQVAIAGAAGIGAYLVTQKLLQYLGGGAQRKEEAGANAALAVREARQQLAQQLGKTGPPPGYGLTAAEIKPMMDAYKAQLIELGYDPVTFTRTRSGVENFLEDYNPFGG